MSVTSGFLGGKIGVADSLGDATILADVNVIGPLSGVPVGEILISSRPNTPFPPVALAVDGATDGLAFVYVVPRDGKSFVRYRHFLSWENTVAIAGGAAFPRVKVTRRTLLPDNMAQQTTVQDTVLIEYDGATEDISVADVKTDVRTGFPIDTPRPVELKGGDLIIVQVNMVGAIVGAGGALTVNLKHDTPNAGGEQGFAFSIGPVSTGSTTGLDITPP